MFQKLLFTCHCLLKLYILLTKLTASLSIPIPFRWIPPRFRPLTLMFSLSTMCTCYANRCSLALLTVSVAFPLSLLLIRLDIRFSAWGSVYLIKDLSDNNLSETFFGVLVGMSLVPICKITLSGAFFKKG